MAGFRRPESVLVVVYTDQADVLLLKRREPFSFWQSVTGALNDNESRVQAAGRELREETGLTAEGEMTDTERSRAFEIDPRWSDRYAPAVSCNAEHEFRYKLPTRAPVRLDEREHEGYQWMDIQTAIGTVWSWTNKEALARLQDDL